MGKDEPGLFRFCSGGTEVIAVAHGWREALGKFGAYFAEHMPDRLILGRIVLVDALTPEFEGAASLTERFLEQFAGIKVVPPSWD